MIHPLFLSVTYSRYDENKVVWSGPFHQGEALGFHLDLNDPDNLAVMDDVQSEMSVGQGGDEIVYSDNPCHYNMIFCGFAKSKYMIRQ